MNRKEFAQKRSEISKNSIDELLELLSSDDLETRFFAEMALRDATST
jgi:hypothetical protein